MVFFSFYPVLFFGFYAVLLAKLLEKQLWGWSHVNLASFEMKVIKWFDIAGANVFQAHYFCKYCKN